MKLVNASSARRALYAAVFLLTLPLVTAGQAGYRLVRGGVSSVGSKTPALELVDVTVAGAQIRMNQPFRAEDGWQKSLTFKLRNTSAKRITFIEIKLSLPETRAGGDARGFSLRFGRESGAPADALAGPYLAPGEEVALSLTAEEGSVARIASEL